MGFVLGKWFTAGCLVVNECKIIETLTFNHNISSFWALYCKKCTYSSFLADCHYYEWRNTPSLRFTGLNSASNLQILSDYVHAETRFFEFTDENHVVIIMSDTAFAMWVSILVGIVIFRVILLKKRERERERERD